MLSTVGSYTRPYTDPFMVNGNFGRMAICLSVYMPIKAYMHQGRIGFWHAGFCEGRKTGELRDKPED